MSNIHKFTPLTAGEAYRIPPNDVLEACKDIGLEDVLVIGKYPNGEVCVHSSVNIGQTVILLETAKHHLLFGGLA